MFLAGVFVLLALTGIGSATPLCDPQTFMPCITPVMTYFMSPEASSQMGKNNFFDSITETQLVSVCRVARTALQCITGAAERCIPSELTELREFMTGANRLMNVCDRPDLHSRTRLLMQCAETLNETSRSARCSNIVLREAMAGIKGQLGRSRSDTIEQWQSGGIMKKLCCNIQYYGTCRGTEVADKCGAETQQIEDDIQHALLAAFSCNGERVASCPARAPPTEEDGNLDLQVALNQLMTMGSPPGMGSSGRS